FRYISRGTGASPVNPNGRTRILPAPPEDHLYQDECSFIGWRWLCPACKKPVRKIYYPVSMRLISGFLRLDPALQLTHLSHSAASSTAGPTNASSATCKSPKAPSTPTSKISSANTTPPTATPSSPNSAANPLPSTNTNAPPSAVSRCKPFSSKASLSNK